jgi:hypothetical protein
MRIRSIKPDFWKSEKVARLPMGARLFFIGLWNLADDHGRFRAHPKILRGELFPFDEDADVAGWLRALQAVGLVALYEVDGSTFGWVCGFDEHQKIDRRSASRLPAPPDTARKPACSAEVQPIPANKPAEPADTLVEPAEVWVLEKEKEEEKEEEKEREVLHARAGDRRGSAEEPEPKAPRPPGRPQDVPEQIWADWIAHRKKIKASPSQTALEGYRREAAKAGITLAEAMAITVAQGWRGFRADWVQPKHKARQQHNGFSNNDYGMTGDL